ncbi:MAG TPA: R3H domain-containing nucleic acid-binding protein [Candidatus Pacearchaeota archaeon]|nr:hypothetical protein [Candidatus Parcubacteria bacterium]HOU45638.1 R3H domain-containing nucleic acid-binding protein [Candidatus Pacearchaeota archaeon]HPM08300.1 R3H domain-containing nucleic acid-binding protein [Candidatus Pacearchaeota archaeon]HQI74567.1 R3H domain-containing nucleic acid-binding protein [Candidatus Pacearchaeota archaeon]
MNNTESKIKESTQIFFKNMGFLVEIKSLELKDEIYFLNLESDDARILIGEGGDILFKIQSILNKIINKELDQDLCLDLDINGYKKTRTQYLMEISENLAKEVAESGQAKSIGNLSAYERRVIHMQISQFPDLSTESVGEGEERKIIIKPK